MKVNIPDSFYISPWIIAQSIASAKDFIYPWIKKDGKINFTMDLTYYLEKIPGLKSFCKYLSDKCHWENRKIVRIDDHDVWNLDVTLAHIIAPSLRKYKKISYGYFIVDDEDYPEWNTPVPDDSDSEEHQDRVGLARWGYVVDEMIFAFEAIRDHSPMVYEADPEIDSLRVKNGLRLFGKYYSHLWN